MANNCSNTLTAYGSKEDIKHFVETFTEDYVGDTLQIRDLLLEENQDRCCTIWYITRWHPHLEELIELLAEFPTLLFKLSYSELLYNFAGRLITEGGNVLYDEMFEPEDTIY